MIFTYAYFAFLALPVFAQTSTQPIITTQATIATQQATTQAVRPIGLTIDSIQKRIKQAETLADESVR